MDRDGIKKRLTEIDGESRRPVRAILSGTADVSDIDTLRNLDKEAVALRDELHRLSFGGAV